VVLRFREAILQAPNGKCRFAVQKTKTGDVRTL
jgi:hypothetical protein